MAANTFQSMDFSALLQFVEANGHQILTKDHPTDEREVSIQEDMRDSIFEPCVDFSNAMESESPSIECNTEVHEVSIEEEAKDAELEPYVGMEFKGENETYSYYNDYAKFVGFGVRKQHMKRSKLNNDVISRTYVCSKEGQKHTIMGVENPRPNTRFECKAMMKVKRIENGRWVVTQFIGEHNHELEHQSSRFFRSHRKIHTPEKNVIRTLKSASIGVPKIMATLCKQSGGVRNIQFTDKDCINFCDKEKRESLSAEDAHLIHKFFTRTQLSNPRFFYAMELGEEGHLMNVFWIDARSRMAYAHFGDVVTFDTTYLTNKFAMKFTPFVGVNHHGQSILLGCALLTDESKELFVWVFKTWLAAMEGRAPKSIITDQDRSIKVAIEEVLPNTCHRFCLWHILKKIPEKLGSVCRSNPEFMCKFDKCIYDTLRIDEFESRWKSLLEEYGLIEHDWLELIYKYRSQWVPVFLKDTFFAGMSTSQRSESVNSFFDDYVNRKTCLKEFVEQYDLALAKRYNDEEKADFETRQKSPNLKTTSPYEAQMASIYTYEAFKKFQEEVLRMLSCVVGQNRYEEEKEVHVVKEVVVKPNGKTRIRDYDVEWVASSTSVRCICRLFEFKGFLCRHAMVVLFGKEVYEIPRRYILKRWTKDAKNMDVFDEDCNEVEEDGPGYKAKCFSDLCVDCVKLAEEGSLSREKYTIVKRIVKEALDKLSSLEDSVHHSKEGFQVESTIPNIIIRDPRVSTSKGRPSSTSRIKGGVEKSKSRKTYNCSKCKKPGHNILSCKEAKKILDDFEESANVMDRMDVSVEELGND